MEVFMKLGVPGEYLTLPIMAGLEIASKLGETALEWANQSRSDTVYKTLSSPAVNNLHNVVSIRSVNHEPGLIPQPPTSAYTFESPDKLRVEQLRKMRAAIAVIHD